MERSILGRLSTRRWPLPSHIIDRAGNNIEIFGSLKAVFEYSSGTGSHGLHRIPIRSCGLRALLHLTKPARSVMTRVSLTPVKDEKQTADAQGSPCETSDYLARSPAGPKRPASPRGLSTRALSTELEFTATSSCGNVQPSFSRVSMTSCRNASLALSRTEA